MPCRLEVTVATRAPADLDRVDRARLGLRRSIAERTAECGGEAAVWSAPGRGAVVRMSVGRAARSGRPDGERDGEPGRPAVFGPTAALPGACRHGEPAPGRGRRGRGRAVADGRDDRGDLPAVALIQVLANAHDYRQPAAVIAVWLVVLGAAAWLSPRMRARVLSGAETAAAIAIAIAAVTVVGAERQGRVMPGSVDLAILGTMWLLVVVVMSVPIWVSVPAALTVYGSHSALLIRAEGVNPLAMSELEAAGYMFAAFLIAAAVLRPTMAVHVSLGARRASLASRSAANAPPRRPSARSGGTGSRYLRGKRCRCCAASRTGRWTRPPVTSGTGAPGTPRSCGTPSPRVHQAPAMADGLERACRPPVSEGCW